jgi:hypothetical protein
VSISALLLRKAYCEYYIEDMYLLAAQDGVYLRILNFLTPLARKTMVFY